MSVYFVQSGVGGPVKIGFARDIRKRLHHLQISSPVRLILLGFIDGDVAAEKRTHQQFAHYRLRGEWFSPDVIPELPELQQLPKKPYRVRAGTESALSQWLQDNGVGRTEFARRIGMTGGYVTQLCTRETCPSLQIFVRIREVTGHPFEPEDFLPLQEAAEALAKAVKVLVA